MLQIYLPEQFGSVPPSADFDPGQLDSDQPSAHIAVLRDSKVAARCSVWWEGTPNAEQGRSGAIGHFAAADADSANELLAAACASLRDRACVVALAPMNGNTWRSYRYAATGSQRPPFLLEPPPALGRDEYLLSAGFSPINRYASYCEPLDALPAQAQTLGAMESKGFHIRSLDTSNLQEELARVYDLAVLAFRENPYYTDLPRPAFVRQYLAYRAMLVPELILLAFHGNVLAGFLFCLPDYNPEDAPTKTLLLKTLAVLPAYRSVGLGGGLMALAKRRAWDMGYTGGIGALVYSGNLSEKLCHTDNILREYTLYGRTL